MAGATRLPRHDDDEAFRRGERMGRVGFDSRVSPPLDGRSPVSHPTCEVTFPPVPFPPRRSGEYWQGMIPARPLYQGGCGSVWDPEPSKERVGDWGVPATVWSLFCVVETRATRPNGEWGYSTRRQCWPRVPSGDVTLKRRCTFRPSVIYLIVNKLLSLSFSLSLSLSLSLSGDRQARAQQTRNAHVSKET